MKNLSLVFVSLLISNAGFSQTVVRTTDIYTKIGTFKLDVAIDTTKTGKGLQITHGEYTTDDPCTAERTYCTSQLLAITHNTLKYTLKDSSGKMLSEQNLNARIEAGREIEKENGLQCKPLISNIDQLGFIHADEFVDFKVFDKNGNEFVLAVSTVFGGSIAIQNQIYQMKANPPTEAHWFLNNPKDDTDTTGATRGNAQLIDPNAPVVNVDAYCAAHPYDCD